MTYRVDKPGVDTHTLKRRQTDRQTDAGNDNTRRLKEKKTLEKESNQQI